MNVARNILFFGNTLPQFVTHTKRKKFCFYSHNGDLFPKAKIEEYFLKRKQRNISWSQKWGNISWSQNKAIFPGAKMGQYFLEPKEIKK
jgi:hypothetical protein